jgi:hypothetical protein
MANLFNANGGNFFTGIAVPAIRLIFELSTQNNYIRYFSDKLLLVSPQINQYTSDFSSSGNVITLVNNILGYKWGSCNFAIFS